MTAVAVVGAGAIGGFFAAHLAAPGSADRDVSVCVRTPFEHLRVDDGDRVLDARPRVLTSATQVTRPADWVLLAVKAHQTDGASPWLRALCGPGTRLVVLQNGVEHEQRVAPLVPSGTRIIPAVVYCGAEVLEPGRILHRNHGFVIVPSSPDADELVALYDGSGAQVRPTDDFVTAAWQKLAANVVANGVTALTLRRFEVFGDPSIAALARALAIECIEVAQAEGAGVDVDYAELLVSGVQSVDPSGGTSMLYDRIAGRPLEHDAIHGAVVRAADRHSLPAPHVRAVTALLAGLSAGFP